MLESLHSKGFDVLTRHHARAILEHDMPAAIAEIEQCLLGIQIPIEELIRGGGGEGKLTQRLRRSFEKVGWKKHTFELLKNIDGTQTESRSHMIDHVRRLEAGTAALEIEWNNKDPFFDRDLDNFKRLHADGAISIGIIVTRGSTLQAELKGLVAAFARDRGIDSSEGLATFYQPTKRQKSEMARAEKSKGSFADGWAQAFVSDKFGEATTHWRKLEERVRRGVGNPCPLLLIGIPRSVVVP